MGEPITKVELSVRQWGGRMDSSMTLTDAGAAQITDGILSGKYREITPSDMLPYAAVNYRALGSKVPPNTRIFVAPIGDKKADFAAYGDLPGVGPVVLINERGRRWTLADVPPLYSTQQFLAAFKPFPKTTDAEKKLAAEMLGVAYKVGINPPPILLLDELGTVSDAAGVTVSREGQAFIIINAKRINDINIGTIVHELGHLVKKDRDPTEVVKAHNDLNAARTDEFEADKFAVDMGYGKELRDYLYASAKRNAGRDNFDNYMAFEETQISSHPGYKSRIDAIDRAMSTTKGASPVR